MMRLPKQIRIQCPNCNTVDYLTNQHPSVREHKILLACNKCKMEMHITEMQVEEWKGKAQELIKKQGKNK